MDKQLVIEELRCGNERFLSGQLRERTHTPADTAWGQSPFCVVLSCADSRVPVELIFDQEIGDLFVIRVAGNVASEECVASAEFAVAHLGTRVMMVLGHTGCGAVSLACDHVDNIDTLPSDNFKRLISRIAPSVRATEGGDPSTHVTRAITHNIHASVQQIRQSPVIQQTEHNASLEYIEAIYDLETGRVRFLNG